MIIYKITNKINGKIYIGQTRKTPYDRFKQHLRDACRLDNALSRAVRKYGKQNFYIEQIEECETDQDLNYREIYWIKYFNSIDKKIGYNCNSGGNYYVLNEETRKKISDSHKGKILSEQTKQKISEHHADVSLEKNPMYGKFHSPIAKQNMSEKKKIKYIGAGNPFFNKKHSEITRKKISIARCGKKHSEETKQKLSQSRIGEKNPRAKLRESDIIEIRLLISQNKKLSYIAELYSVKYNSILDIKKGKRWKHI